MPLYEAELCVPCACGQWFFTSIHQASRCASEPHGIGSPETDRVGAQGIKTFDRDVCVDGFLNWPEAGRSSANDICQGGAGEVAVEYLRQAEKLYTAPEWPFGVAGEGTRRVGDGTTLGLLTEEARETCDDGLKRLAGKYDNDPSNTRGKDLRRGFRPTFVWGEADVKREIMQHGAVGATMRVRKALLPSV